MIIRRISTGIKAQDWFVVMIEVLIVVVGIFLGLQVDDWNEARKDREDEQVFLSNLHEELLSSTNTRGFLRAQRLEDGEILLKLLFNIFEDPDLEELSSRECTAIARSSFLTANIAEMPSFNALLATGRLNIISDEKLKTALVRFEQQRQKIQRLTSNGANDLSGIYPHLLKLKPIREANGNIEGTATCNLQDLRADSKFMNHFVSNVDGFEAYITSGLKPIVASIEPLHLLLDKNLNLNH